MSSVTWVCSSKLMAPEAQLQQSSAGSDPGPVVGQHYHPLLLLAAGKSSCPDFSFAQGW